MQMMPFRSINLLLAALDFESLRLPAPGLNLIDHLLDLMHLLVHILLCLDIYLFNSIARLDIIDLLRHFIKF